MTLLAYPIDGTSSVSAGSYVPPPPAATAYTAVPLLEPDLTPPSVPMSGGPAIVATFPSPDSFGTTGTNVVPAIPAPASQPLTPPPQGCNKCGSPPIVAPASSGAPVAPTAPAAVATASVQSWIESVPWWVWIIVAVFALRGLLK